jgi:hypothetical protein
VWWRYAVRAVQQQQSARKLTWKQALTVGAGRGAGWHACAGSALFDWLKARFHQLPAASILDVD